MPSTAPPSSVRATNVFATTPAWTSPRTRGDAFKLDSQPPATGPRPVTVTALADGDSRPVQPGVGVLRVPSGATPADRDVMYALALIAALRLHTGASTEYALTIAAGRDTMADVLDTIGRPRHPRTVGRSLERLAATGWLQRVGQLDDWTTQHGEHRKGAYVYRLPVLVQTVVGHMKHVLSRVPARRHQSPSPSNATVRGQGRVQKCLEAAKRLAKIGNRNDVGHWLTRRCIDAGLGAQHTTTVMLDYRAAVPSPATYTVREVQATVRSAYKP